jgi:virginiamycin A acetyltransferase
VWIGYGATILSGVKIGHGAIVGAKSLVSKDVPNYAIVAGNPARVIGFRFNDSQIDELLKLAWWNWEIEDIKARISQLSSRPKSF